MKKAIYMFSAGALSLILIAVFIADSKGISAAASGSLNFCLTVIAPSLFAFMALSSFIMESGVYKVIFKPLYWVIKPVLRISEDEFSIFALSLIGGYPVGAKLLSERDNDYSKRAETALVYCYCGSPAFISALNNSGVLIWVSNALACLIFAIFINIKNKRTPAKINGSGDINKKSANLTKAKANLAEIFINSVTGSGKALFKICSMIIIFAVLIRTAEFLKLLAFLSEAQISVFRAIMETSNCVSVSGNGVLISALTSFGGICVLFQVSVISNGKINLKNFLLARIPIAVLSGGIYFIISKFTGVEETFAVSVITNNAESRVIMFSGGSAVASLCLIIMTLILLATSERNNKRD